MKIAFIINFNPHKWLGGINVIKNLIYCLNSFSKNKIEVVLIVNKNLSKKESLIFKGLTVIKTNIFYNQNFIEKNYHRLNTVLLGRSNHYEKFFSKEKINFVLHINVFSSNIFFGKKSVVKTLSFIPDLQHIYLKKNVSFAKRVARNINIFLCALFSTKILLSSECSKKDIKKISSLAWKNSFVSKFVFKSPRKNDILDIDLLKKKYKFNQPYFYLPNQYWIHKNHFVILKALKYINDKYHSKKILIISSGNSEDYRNPLYFGEIKNYILKNNLKSYYKYVGLIPFRDVMSLMYHSLAVINPSKFEGRSSTVEQAKSLGKKIILSNINIHKEQNPKYAKYFRAEDFKKLSSILIKESNKVDNFNPNINYNKAVKKNKKDLENYYKNYVGLLKSL